MHGPLLRGRQVTLRPPREQDAEFFVRWFADPEVTATLRRQFPPSLEEEHRFLAGLAGDDTIIFSVIEYEGRPIGSTGIALIDWHLQRGSTGTMIGERSVWARGIGSEAMALRTRFAFTELNLRKLNSSYLEGNEASWKAQQKVGYREVGRLRRQHFRGGRWVDEILTEVLREEWEALQPPP